MSGLDGSSIKRSSRCAAGLPGRSYLPHIPPGSALPRNGCAASKNAMVYAIAFLLFRFFAILRYKRPAGAQCTAAMPCSVLQTLKRYELFLILQAGFKVCICPRGELYANRRHGKSVLRQLRIEFASIAPLCWQRSIFGPIYSLMLQQSTPFAANAKPRSTCSCKTGSLHP